MTSSSVFWGSCCEGIFESIGETYSYIYLSDVKRLPKSAEKTCNDEIANGKSFFGICKKDQTNQDTHIDNMWRRLKLIFQLKLEQETLSQRYFSRLVHFRKLH